ncbi:MAG: hypothetical protein QM688_16340 [Sphingomonas bacterium]
MLKAALVAMSLASLAAAPAYAAPCKDAKGRFIKCPPAKPVKCKDAHGKFIKCSAPGAKPIR